MDLIADFFNKFHYVGAVDPDGPDFVERDSLSHDVGRFFLVVYNTSQTVSSSYATFIVMAISFALAAVFGALYYGIATGFTGFSGRRWTRSTKEEEEESDESKRLLLKILELISMDPSLKVGNNSTDKSENVIGPCLLYRLCEIPTKLWRDKNELHLLDLVHQYSLLAKTESNNVDSGRKMMESVKVGHNGGILACDVRYKTKCQNNP